VRELSLTQIHRNGIDSAMFITKWTIVQIKNGENKVYSVKKWQDGYGEREGVRKTRKRD